MAATCGEGGSSTYSLVKGLAHRTSLLTAKAYELVVLGVEHRAKGFHEVLDVFGCRAVE